VLFTAASGYIAGCLVSGLLAAGYRVRCLVREPRKLDFRPQSRHRKVDLLRCEIAGRLQLTGPYNLRPYC